MTALTSTESGVGNHVKHSRINEKNKRRHPLLTNILSRHSSMKPPNAK